MKCDFFFFFPESKKATVLRQNNTKKFFSKPKHNKHQHATTMRDAVGRLQDVCDGNAHAQDPSAGLLGRKKTCKGLVTRAMRFADTGYPPFERA